MKSDQEGERPWAELWRLRPGVTYLNHGSFGPAPLPVLAARQRWFEQLEEEPLDFFMRRLDPLLAQVRSRLARFVGCRSEDLVFVDNATTGVNVVADSFKLKPGDEVLVNDHEYGAAVRIWQRACDRARARLVTASIGLPVESPQAIVETIMGKVSERTRLLMVSHVTSPTAIIFPLVEICRAARQRGLAVCVDGPHAPAMIDVDIQSLDCDYYAASCHKWMSAPFGSGFLYVHPRAQAAVQPAVMSWGRTPLGDQPSWRDEFQWLGTRDYSAWLAIADAIDFMESLPLAAFRRRTHELARQAREAITELTGLAPLTPDSPDWYGSMVAVPLPAGECQSFQDALWERFGIEVPIIELAGGRLIRVSCHAYTRPEHIERLVTALRELL